ncbi:SOS response-associated peptidase [Rhodoblastus acidophilus]|uniref:Abasic site processing protein n=1 Tax=Candidatus Rhodoblastus alkanivorans TaxID=2954117 RepID=A0ABS9Z773_9HYPH|nr:SOS response-associated peptidase [Candidatus Rhodoblastus alkanivorans]MCI4680635.1 SOS response-associated peptidase [Candidatus Rhodoblastus alkanivorans]MCI4682507.1 SOS response-associated peptidase [Candidatus Rhodoblastus alkanivorans]MDI4639813.1 SOS response-associated peptidase [Rhodoblastus acidophilus]
MCGRFAITSPPEAVRAHFRYVEQPNFPPRYNIAPTQPIPIVTASHSEAGDARHFQLARWGFLPGFVKDPKDFPLIINARAETLAQKPSFRAALRRRRCLVPADAWYEWRANGKGPKTPFLLRRRGGGLMGLAGLWETYTDPSGGEIDTVCIITTLANGATVAIHDRMPALLAPQDYGAWLEPDERIAPPLNLLRPAAEDAVEFFAISPLVNRVVNDGPEIQAPV